MPILVTCTSCGKRIQAPDKMIGQKAQCPKCSAPIVMQPQADTPTPPQTETDDHGAATDPMADLAAALGRQTMTTVAMAPHSASGQQTDDQNTHAAPAKPLPVAAVKPTAVIKQPGKPDGNPKAASERPSQSGSLTSSQMTPPTHHQAQDDPNDDDIALAPLGMQTPSGLPVRRTTAADTEMQRGLANMARIVGIIMGGLAFAIGAAGLILLSLEGRLPLAIGIFFFMLIMAVALAIGGVLLRGSLRMMADMADTQRRQQAALDELLSRMD